MLLLNRSGVTKTWQPNDARNNKESNGAGDGLRGGLNDTWEYGWQIWGLLKMG